MGDDSCCSLGPFLLSSWHKLWARVENMKDWEQSRVRDEASRQRVWGWQGRWEVGLVLGKNRRGSSWGQTQSPSSREQS